MFNDIHQAAEAGYEDRRPLWMSNPDGSIFRVTSRQEMEGKSDQEIQEMFREQNVVIYDQFQPTLGFDERGLSTLGDLLKPVTIHGASSSAFSRASSDLPNTSRLLKGK